MKIFIWGMGAESERLYFPEDIEIIGGIDSNPVKQNGLFHGKRIIAPTLLDNYSYDYILISSLKYEEEILKQIKELEIPLNKILPARLSGLLIHDQFEKMHHLLVTSEHFKIVKDWYQNNFRREIIVKVCKCWGKILMLDIFPYGVFVQNDITQKAEGQIIDLGTNKILFDGKWENIKSLELSLDSDEVVLKISILGNHSCFLGTRYEDGCLLQEIKDMHSAKLQQGLINNLIYCSNQRYHEKDYSFLEMFGDITNGTILDIGANLGQSSLSFLKLTKMDVIAVEPQINLLESLQLIQRNFGKGRMRIENKGAGDICGQLSFFVPAFEKEYSEEASFLQERALARASACNFSKTGLIKKEVPVETVHEMVKNIKKPVFFVKIDAEAFEEKVIHGMRETIKKYHPLILLEYNNIHQQSVICKFVNTVYKYSIKYWNYEEKAFEEKNLCGSLNYFLIPKGFSIERLQKGS